jgi:hypothetical protein
VAVTAARRHLAVYEPPGAPPLWMARALRRQARSEPPASLTRLFVRSATPGEWSREGEYFLARPVSASGRMLSPRRRRASRRREPRQTSRGRGGAGARRRALAGARRDGRGCALLRGGGAMGGGRL